MSIGLSRCSRTTDSLAAGAALRKAGIKPIGKTTYELEDGSIHEYPLGVV